MQGSRILTQKVTLLVGVEMSFFRYQDFSILILVSSFFGIENQHSVVQH